MSLDLRATDKAITNLANVIDSTTIPGAGNNAAAKDEMVMKVDDATSLINLRNAVTVPTKIGTPTYDAAGATITSLSGNAGTGFDTGLIPNEDDQTVWAVFKVTSGSGQMILVGALQAGVGTFGLSINAQAGKITMSNLENSANAAGVTVPVTGNWIFAIGSASSKGVSRLRVGAAGVLGAAVLGTAASGNAHSLITGTSKSGGTQITGATQTSRIRRRGRVARIFSAAEEEALYARLRALATAEGVTIE